MNDDDAFLAAIIADPDNDMPRLVYADYLDERGDSDRAEFIRVQCELAQRNSAQLQSLRELHQKDWQLSQFDGLQRFRRGFIEVVDVSAESLLRHHEQLFRMAPVQELRIRNASGHWANLAAIADLRKIRTLDLSNSETFGNNRINDFLARASLDSLVGLTLRNNQLWAEMLEVLAENPIIAQLTSLDLSGNPIQDRGAELLANHRSFANLKHLRLNSNDQRSEYCIHEAGLNALIHSQTLRQLESLDLGGQYVDDEGLIALLDSNLQQLQTLHLAYVRIGLTGGRAFEELERNPGLPNLLRIDLRGNAINPLAMTCICDMNMGSRPNLFWDLRECDMSAETWQLLSRQNARTGRLELDAEPPM